VSEAISREALARPELSPDAHFRQQLQAAVRDVLSWYPRLLTEASIA
jgi:hypothetical protein